MTREKYLILSLTLTFTSCGTILQNQATKNFKDPITKTAYYKSLNKYQQDFIYLKTICEKYFPKVDDYYPKKDRTKEESETVKKLGNNRITDLEFSLYLKKYLSHFDNQHTQIGSTGLTITGIYPFIPFNRDSSWYILNIAKGQNQNLIGKRIIAFNDVGINEYEKRLFEFVSAENVTSKRKEIANWWNRPTLHEFLLGKPIDSVKITTENGDNIWLKKLMAGKLEWTLTEKDFKSHPITKYRDKIYDYNIIDSLGLTYFQFHECYDKVEINEAMKSYVKPWIRPLANLYVNIQTNKKNPSDRLKKYFDPSRPIFSQYVNKMIKESNDKGIQKLIIDLRGNNGGSEAICLQLMYHLTDKNNLKDFKEYVKNSVFYKHYFEKEYKRKIELYRQANGNIPSKDSLFFSGYSNSDKVLFDKITNPKSPYYIPKERPIFKGKIVIIADYSSHSAGALFTALLQDNGIGQVIGTEVSNNPTGPTSWTPFKLPNSKLQATIPSSYLVRPNPTNGKLLIPDIKAEKAFGDLFNGRDPLFDKAMEILNVD